jgi:hypothetical protein
MTKYIIDIADWDIGYIELINWVNDRNIRLYAIAGFGQGTGYSFDQEEDLVAFKLAFRKEKLVGYEGVTTADVGMHSCPYIPLDK